MHNQLYSLLNSLTFQILMYQRKTWKQIRYKPYRTHSNIHVNTYMKEKASSNYVPTISLYMFNLTNELRHDKTNKMAVRPAKTQISLGIRPVWSAPSLSAWRKIGSLAIYWAHSEDSDQTVWMPRLIWVFAGRTLTLLVLSCGGSNYNLQLLTCRIIWAPSSEFVSSSIPSWQILTAHAQPFRGARDLAFCLKVPLDSLLVWASSEGSGETARMRRLAWTFAARIGDTYQIRLTRSIYYALYVYIYQISQSKPGDLQGLLFILINL